MSEPSAEQRAAHVQRTRLWQKANPERQRAISKRWRDKHGREHYAKNRERILLGYKKWKAENKDARKTILRSWEARNPDKIRAYRILYREKRKGCISPPSTCSVCLKGASVHAHHPDYSRPLFICWVCAACHKETHRLNTDLSVLAFDYGGAQ